MLDDVELSELLAVKLCHDLAGPIGAVSNGIELLKEGGSIYQQAVDLAESSSKDAVARLLFYRQAYGVVKGEAVMSVTSLQELADNFFFNTKVKIHWDKTLFEEENTQRITGGFGKLILNLVLLVSKSLIYGGDVTISMNKKGGKNLLSIKGSGKAANIDAESALLLSEEDKEKLTISVKNVQAYFTCRILSKMGLKSTINKGDDFVEVVVS